MNRFFSGGALIALLVGADMAAAQNRDRLQPDFTFRMVTVPSPGENPNFIQIDPAAPSAIRPPDSFYEDKEGDAEEGEVVTAAAPATTLTGANEIEVPASSGYEWFWSSISPHSEDTGPGRLAEAVRVLGNPPEGSTVATPRLQALQDIAVAHGAEILIATIDTNVSPALVLAVISIESGGQSDAVSGAGASGLMQLMPATAERFGVTDRSDTAQNIQGGVAYLDWLLDKYDGDPILALAGYNAGEGAVRDNNGVPPYPETRGYVPKVLAAWTVARGLCQTPPELIGDGCAFAIGSL